MRGTIDIVHEYCYLELSSVVVGMTSFTIGIDESGAVAYWIDDAKVERDTYMAVLKTAEIALIAINTP